MKPIEFPRDELSHDKIIEWWYWNGHLQGEDGGRYAFMDCLFKADARRVKLPFLKPPFKNTYFSHSLLSDIKRQKFYPLVDYVSLLSRQSFTRRLLSVEYIGADPREIIKGFTVNLMEETAPGAYRIKTENFDLKLKARKVPLREGGQGFLNLSGRQTYYYSLTDLAAEGEIYLPGRTVKVKGKAWMDHQWANAPYEKDRWTWFSLQLECGVDLVVFEYGQNKKDSYAGIIYPGGRQEHFKNIKISPTGEIWQSRQTGARYELDWKIEIPEKKIILETAPLLKKQEIIFGALNYWEGPLAVKGIWGGKKVKGQGFLELVGRPAKFSAGRILGNALTAELKEQVKKILKKRK